MTALDNAKATRLRIDDRLAVSRLGVSMMREMDRDILALQEARAAFDALIAEHERVLAERAAPQQWEYGRTRPGTTTVPIYGVWQSREDAERWGVIDAGPVLRRHPANPASPWEPLPEDTNQTNRSEHAVHWAGEPGQGPTSLHGNGAASFAFTSGDEDEVTCKLCLTLLAREDTNQTEGEK